MKHGKNNFDQCPPRYRRCDGARTAGPEDAESKKMGVVIERRTKID